jgi:hypothetical protein
MSKGQGKDSQTTHGVTKENSVYAQHAKKLMCSQPNWKQERLQAYQREALDMIQHKIARILHGDPNCEDHWADVA